MNKVCAAGTGSFLEEQAAKLGIPLEEFGALALAAPGPAAMGERCSVFMETAVAAGLARGTSLPDIAAGLCYCIVRNYLNRVVGQRRVGRKVCFSRGGLATTRAWSTRFAPSRAAEITVPPFFSVTGAYGAAILAREEMAAAAAPSTFKGFDPKEGKERLDVVSGEPSGDGQARFDTRLGECIFEGYLEAPDPAKKTVGIPRALFGFGMYPMFAPFFQELGFNVLLSRPTSEETLRLAREYALDETCYPVKLVNGHVADLAARKVDYVFFPDLFTVRHDSSRARKNYGCAYMQVAFRLVRRAMDLDGRGIGLLAPTIAHSLGPRFMRDSFMEIGRRLGASDQASGLALTRAMESYQAFEARLGEHAKKTLAGLDPGKKTFVLVSKIYGVADQALNMGIPTAHGHGLRGHPLRVPAHGGHLRPASQHVLALWPAHPRSGPDGQAPSRPVRRLPDPSRLRPGYRAVALFPGNHGRKAVFGRGGGRTRLARRGITRVEAFVRSLEKSAPRGRAGSSRRPSRTAGAAHRPPAVQSCARDRGLPAARISLCRPSPGASCGQGR
jgi:hypothetical protein